ncbi:hypothetical protein SLA2020_146240 [Shorea laevis]
MQNRIPTKKNLQKCKVLSSEDDMSCALCGEKVESSDHLLFMCPKAWNVWSSCYNWWGISVVSQDKGWNHLFQHAGLFNDMLTKGSVDGNLVCGYMEYLVMEKSKGLQGDL